ncbi:MAG: hypothetical protein AAF688_06920 [Bacteroidota bacterium]
MSDTKKVNYLSYGAVAILAIVCFYFVYKTSALKADVSRLMDLQEVNNLKIESEQVISDADSLLINGKYQEALNQYEQISGSSAMDTELRKTIALKLLHLERKVKDKNLNLDANQITDLGEINVDETTNEKTFDSLNFALEKAQMQLSSIKKQMKEKVYGEYITFKSTKGNRLHYVGQVKNKKANGVGVAILDSGSRYEGEWMDNKRHGQGTFYWIDGEHYEGSYEDDLRSGQGIYYWTNGEKYVGNWDKDKRNGKGTFYGKDGKVLTSGVWEYDELIEEDK